MDTQIRRNDVRRRLSLLKGHSRRNSVTTSVRSSLANQRASESENDTWPSLIPLYDVTNEHGCDWHASRTTANRHCGEIQTVYGARSLTAPLQFAHVVTVVAPEGRLGGLMSLYRVIAMCNRRWHDTIQRRLWPPLPLVSLSFLIRFFFFFTRCFFLYGVLCTLPRWLTERI